MCGAEQTGEPRRQHVAPPSRRAPIEVDFADTVQPELDESMGHRVPMHAANEEMKPEIGTLRPGALWQMEAAEAGRPRHWAGSARLPLRLATSIGATLAVVVLAMLVDHFYLDKQSPAGQLRAFRTNVEQTRGALLRGDLAAADRLLDDLETRYGDDPGVQELRASFDRLAQEHAARSEPPPQAAPRAPAASVPSEPVAAAAPVARPPDDAQRATEALGLAAPAATPPVSSAVAVPAAAFAAPERGALPSAPAPLPTSEVGVAPPDERECNDTLAALALCSQR